MVRNIKCYLVKHYIYILYVRTTDVERSTKYIVVEHIIMSLNQTFYFLKIIYSRYFSTVK